MTHHYYSEPYFARVARYKDQERARKIQQKKKKKEMKADDEMNMKKSALPNDTSDPSLEFDERAIARPLDNTHHLLGWIFLVSSFRFEKTEDASSSASEIA